MDVLPFCDHFIGKLSVAFTPLERHRCPILRGIVLNMSLYVLLAAARAVCKLPSSSQGGGASLLKSQVGGP